LSGESVRYYDLTIQQPGASQPFAHWTSYPSGKPDSNALNIEFDIPVAPQATPIGMQTVTIYGVPMKMITEAYRLTGAGSPGAAPTNPMNVVLKAGMGGGLPLENPKQKGVILQGSVFQSFGNWEGTDMTLDVVVSPAAFTHDNPGNFVLSWTKGTQLSDALQQCLATA
jgi:hypothetical protein